MERFALTLFRLKGSLGISLINTRLQLFRAVIKSRGLGISLGHYKHGPWLLSLENRRKIEPRETPSCLIPGPLSCQVHTTSLVVCTWQLEILVTNPKDRLDKLLSNR